MEFLDFTSLLKDTFSKVYSFLPDVQKLCSTKPRAYFLLQEALESAKDYGDWHSLAQELDILEGNEKWKKNPRSSMYDDELIETRLRHLRKARESGDCDAMVFLLRGGLVRSLGGIGNPQLYMKCFVGTKQLIENYIDEVVHQLNMICDMDTPFFGLLKKEIFFADTRQAFGRSALLLSGGASLGMYHFGVVKCLYEFNLLPRVISGGSVGSLVVALLGVHNDEEIPALFQDNFIDFEAFLKVGQKGSVRRKLTRLLKHGVLMDVNVLEEFCKKNIGPLTFLEAYKKTGRIINITVASTQRYEMPRLLNYLSSPNVLLWSAAVASCASPGIYNPVDLLARDHEGNLRPWNPSKHKWTDASFENDLPMARLSELFNINHFIVSQVNPHVAPFLCTKKKSSFLPSKLFEVSSSWVLSELHHRALQLMEVGFIPSVLKWFQPLLSQKYQGDITIVPDISPFQALKYLTNPSEASLRECIKAGEMATWPYVSAIRTHCKIELTLDICLKRVRKQMDQKVGTVCDKERYLGPVFTSIGNPSLDPKRIPKSAQSSTKSIPSPVTSSSLAKNLDLEPSVEISALNDSCLRRSF